MFYCNLCIARRDLPEEPEVLFGQCKCCGQHNVEGHDVLLSAIYAKTDKENSHE